MKLKDKIPLACPECGCRDNLESVERCTIHYSLSASDPSGEFDYDGEGSRTFDECAVNTAPGGHFDLWCRDCDHEWRAELEEPTQ